MAAWVRGPNKTPQDRVVVAMASDYAGFLRQTPWYMYPFDREVTKLWAAPVDQWIRGWERRVGIGIEFKAKAAYAKVIAQAETRDLAIARLVTALRQFPVLGIVTNIPFLIRVLEHPSFRSGEMHTGFLDREGATLADSLTEPPPPFVQAAMAAAGSPRKLCARPRWKKVSALGRNRTAAVRSATASGLPCVSLSRPKRSRMFGSFGRKAAARANSWAAASVWFSAA